MNKQTQMQKSNKSKVKSNIYSEISNKNSVQSNKYSVKSNPKT